MTPPGLGALGRLVAAAFVLLLASTNAITPLLPIYRADLALSPVAATAVFAVYMLVLAPTLWACSRPTVQRHAGLLLPLALVAIVAGNVLMATETVGGLFAGRIISGVAVGIGTGATATLALVALGERGRTIAATGNLVGAVLGTTLSAVTAQWSPWPLSTGYVTLAGAALVVAAALTIAVRARRDHLAGLRVDVGVALDADPLEDAAGVRRRAAGLVVGCIAWVVVMEALVVVPGAVRELLGLESPLLSGAMALLFLVSAAVSQFAIGRFPRALGLSATVGYLLAGTALIAVGLLVSQLPLLCLGMVVAGVGNGAGYRSGLAQATVGLPPARHGAATSRYVFITYFVGGVCALVTAWIASHLGVVPTWWLTLAAISVTAVIALRLRAGLRTA